MFEVCSKDHFYILSYKKEGQSLLLHVLVTIIKNSYKNMKRFGSW